MDEKDDPPAPLEELPDIIERGEVRRLEGRELARARKKIFLLSISLRLAGSLSPISPSLVVSIPSPIVFLLLSWLFCFF